MVKLKLVVVLIAAGPLFGVLESYKLLVPKVKRSFHPYQFLVNGFLFFQKVNFQPLHSKHKLVKFVLVYFALFSNWFIVWFWTVSHVLGREVIFIFTDILYVIGCSFNIFDFVCECKTLRNLLFYSDCFNF